MDTDKFLQEHEYIDFSSPVIIQKAGELFNQADNDVDKTRIAYAFVRDEIPTLLILRRQLSWQKHRMY